MKLILVRHGEAESNAKRLVGGQLDFKLTNKGIEQAKKLANRFKDEKIDVVFCSTLSRAKDTAKEILKYHPDVKAIYNDKLKEFNFGEFQGNPVEKLYAALQAFEGPIEEFQPKGGESFKQLIERAKSIIKEFEEYHGKTVLVVSHGRITRAILHVLLSKPLDEMMKEKFYNTSVTILELKEGKYHTISYNCAKHLEIL